MSYYQPAQERGYLPLADHALIGNLRTAAVVSLDGSIESYCVPHFDSPSVFARILDRDKGGHFSIKPTIPYTSKQNYLPSSNVLQTRFMNDAGVVSVTDFLPRPLKASATGSTHEKPLLPWLIRRVECIRGALSVNVECAPAFNYARNPHVTSIVDDESVPLKQQKKVLFEAADLTLDLRYVIERTMDDVEEPIVLLTTLDLSSKGHKGLAAQTFISLVEGQAVTFILRNPPGTTNAYVKTPVMVCFGLTDVKTTNRYWYDWIRQSTYTGSWKEAVHRSALALKLLIFEPTGAVVASPTFSLPEYIGGTRNWDYRYSWIRDSSFTLYALIRLGFTEEANAYLEFIFERLRDKNPDGSLQIMYTIHGEKEIPEIELTHMDGHKGSKPVRIGNGASDHKQLDIYGELMDCIYLGQKFGKPLVLKSTTSSQIMLWVAIDRGLRLADKRSLPCPNRFKWLQARDELYEEIMNNAWDKQGKFFGQSYEETDVLDSAVLIMPLVLFMQASDPRFVSTLKQILKTPDKGGLTSNNLVYRYDTRKSDDGVGGAEGTFCLCTLWCVEALTRAGETDKVFLRRAISMFENLVYRYDTRKSDDGVGGAEGTFCLCTLWCVEALTRAGETDKVFLRRAISMFEDFLLYLNHVGLCTEEISDSGEALGNAVQGFTHVTLISAAYNLSRTLSGGRSM
ncbi:hypothetical protein AN958_11733 [Leucoagaricus sp. SymC.cos]|nr:hypothetical protein AN958_11733 [Leucoagaricus sp. SymC.cos]